MSKKLTPKDAALNKASHKRPRLTWPKSNPYDGNTSHTPAGDGMRPYDSHANRIKAAKHAALKNKLPRGGIDFKAIRRDQEAIDKLPNRGRVK